MGGHDSFIERVGLKRILISALVLFLAGCATSTPQPSPEPFTGLLVPPSSSMVPPDGTVMPNWSTFDSLQEAQSKITFPLLIPRPEVLPNGWNFDNAQILSADKPKAALLIYKGNGQELDIQIIQLEGSLAPPQQPHETIQFDGKTGYYFSTAGSDVHALVWELDGLMLSLSGKFDQEQLVRIAGGMVSFIQGKY